MCEMGSTCGNVIVYLVTQILKEDAATPWN